MNDLDRFMSKVSPEPNTGCWLWTAGVDKDGYGKFATGKHRAQTHHRAHKWIIGAPKGAVAMHSCDQPSCVNPAHLRVGTQAENRADCTRKGRNARGESHPRAKLSLEAVREIRARLELGEPIRAIALAFGISRGSVWEIKTGTTWRHVA